MDLHIKWTSRSLQNAQEIKSYLDQRFSTTEVKQFELTLRKFEQVVIRFPKMYPASSKYPGLRRAVVHKNTTIYYSLDLQDQIVVIAIQDNRQILSDLG